jgi:hypothetical protein
VGANVHRMEILGKDQAARNEGQECRRWEGYLVDE